MNSNPSVAKHATPILPGAVVMPGILALSRRMAELAPARGFMACVLLAGMPHTSVHAASNALESMLTAFNIAAMIALVALVPAFVFYVRWRTLRRLQALMMTRSQEAGPADAEAEAPEAATLFEPVLTVFDDLGQLPGAEEARELFVQRAVSVLRKALAVDALAALGYALLPLLMHTIAPADDGNTEGLEAGIGFGVLFLLLAAIRYMLFRTQFRAIDQRSRLERSVMIIINLLLMFVPINIHPMTLLQYLLAPRVQIFFLVGWIGLMVWLGLDLPEPGLIAAALLHVGLAVWFARRLQRIPGKRLVVLRVFGLDKNAQFLFDGVLAFWKHFGHFFTVVDPAYWRHSHRVLSLGTLAFVLLAVAAIAFGFVLYALLPGNLPEDFAPLAATAFAVPMLAGYAWFSQLQLDRTFIRSKAHLNELLASIDKHPRNFDMSYKSLETRCFDNTWKIAVAEFARQCDVVVMDLRGYSPAREGCQFEVNFLLDAVPVERIVFLLDEESEPDTASQLILEAWKELRASSPNLATDTPELRLYVAATKDVRDIQGVIDLLISAAAARRSATV